jgi:hypothetical protein
MSVEAMKVVKLELKALVAQFCAESSIYKISKFAIDAQTKAISSHLKKVLKNDRQHRDLSANVADDTWTDNPLALAVLGHNTEGVVRVLSDLDGMEETKLSGVPDEPLAIKMHDFLTWAEKIKGGQYFKTQRSFLQGWLKKNSGYSSQESQIKVTLLQTELDAMSRSLPCSLAVPKESATEPWGKSFGWSFSLATQHCTVGVAAYCLGELLLGIEGALGLAKAIYYIGSYLF